MITDARFLPYLFILLLTGCSYNPFIPNNHTTGSPGAAILGAGVAGGTAALMGAPKPLIAVAGITGGAFGYYITTLRHDAGPIIAAGGQVYRLGEMIGIDLPSDKLFEPNTADLIPQAEPILLSAATILKRYPNNSILISGNTSGFAKARWEQCLSQKRAEVISAFFWNQGINSFKDQSLDARDLTYVGYNHYFPIANSFTNKGIRQNSRIQITSYPTSCELKVAKRQLFARNIGSISDDTLYSAPDTKCPTDENGNCVGAG